MARDAKAAVFGWLACACGLVVLMLAAYTVAPIQRLDATILSHLSAHKDTAAGTFAELIAHLGDPLPLVLMLAAVCAYAVHRARPRAAIAAVVLVSGANLTTQILKVALAHPRHQAILGENQLSAAAFPSGHATAAASIALALLFVVPRRRLPEAAALGALYVVAIGISVLVLDWHFPSDVLGGILVASGWACAVRALLLLTRRSPRGSGVGWPSELPSR